MYALVTTSHFDRREVKFTRTHPERKKHLAKVLRDLESDPFSRASGFTPSKANWKTSTR